jgi:hypothetical protein
VDGVGDAIETEVTSVFVPGENVISDFNFMNGSIALIGSDVGRLFFQHAGQGDW